MTTTTQQQIADLLTARRIDWRKVRSLGGDLNKIAREARAHGDEDLYRKATRAAR